MKVKTSDLIDVGLDWAVAKCEGFKYELYEHNRKKWENGLHRPQHWQPSTNWAQGGPIIDREIGNLWKHNKLDPNEYDVWTAAAYRKAPDGTMLYYEDGPTPLIAAMRCFVSSKLGDEVDIPKELT